MSTVSKDTNDLSIKQILWMKKIQNSKKSNISMLLDIQLYP